MVSDGYIRCSGMSLSSITEVWELIRTYLKHDFWLMVRSRWRDTYEVILQIQDLRYNKQRSSQGLSLSYQKNGLSHLWNHKSRRICSRKKRHGRVRHGRQWQPHEKVWSLTVCFMMYGRALVWAWCSRRMVWIFLETTQSPASDVEMRHGRVRHCRMRHGRKRRSSGNVWSLTVCYTIYGRSLVWAWISREGFNHLWNISHRICCKKCGTAVCGTAAYGTAACGTSVCGGLRERYEAWRCAS